MPRALLRPPLAAAVLAALGLLLAEAAGAWLAAQPAGARPGGDRWAADVSSTLRTRLPLGMAAWGFGLALLAEGGRALGRRPAARPAPAPARGPVGATDSEVEALFNDLLARAEAAPVSPEKLA